MSDLSVQFHATPGEIAAFIEEVFRDAPLFSLGISFAPFVLSEIEKEKLVPEISNGSCWRFVFLKERPSCPILSAKDLGEKHPMALYLDVGRETPEGLKESWLGCRTPAGTAVDKTWKTVALKLRAITQAGVTALDPYTGAKAFLKSHRYTPGAKKLFDAGGRILPIAGRALIQLED